MNKTLFKTIWQFLDLILYIVGIGCIVGALFLWSIFAGLIGLGVACILTGLLIDLQPQSKGGGDQ
ncbi:DUF1056 family protein [Lactobacillus crispatus]|nr:DUF1056 family protein [Lactobacillus crispatus]